jgi:hypothetical protein
VTLLGNFEDSTTIYIVQEMCGKVRLHITLPPGSGLKVGAPGAVAETLSAGGGVWVHI